MVFFPLFLIAPGGSGLHEPRVLDMLADIGRVVLGAADDHGRIAAALYRRLECLLRGLLRVACGRRGGKDCQKISNSLALS